MRTLEAIPLPYDLTTFRLPIPRSADILGMYETDGLVAFVLDPKDECETVFHAFRPGDEVPEHLEFVASGQRLNGIVVMLFRDKAGAKTKEPAAAGRA
jgi:hypothetical protein